MGTEQVHLTKEKETLLPTLYGRALDARSSNPILGDTFADALVRRLNFDFESLRLPKGAAVSLPIRARHLDGWTREFLAANPVSTVLHLGCGLDSRVLRIDPPPSVRWYEVDHPEVIELRRRLHPARANCSLIGTGVTDLRWLDEIPAEGPVLVVAEGLVVYLPEEEGIALFRAITGKFPGGEFAFDAYSKPMVWLTKRLATVKKTGAVLAWGFGDPKDLERQVPRLRLVDAVPFLTMPELGARLSRTCVDRAVFRLMERSGFVQRLVRHLRYRF